MIRVPPTMAEVDEAIDAFEVATAKISIRSRSLGDRMDLFEARDRASADLRALFARAIERPVVDVGAFEEALDLALGEQAACAVEGQSGPVDVAKLNGARRVPIAIYTAAIEARDRAEADAKKLRDDYALGVDQFNEGYEVARKWIGEMPTDPRSAEPGWRDQGTPDMDTFGGGFTWGGYEKVIAERDREKQRADEAELKYERQCGGTLSRLHEIQDLRAELAKVTAELHDLRADLHHRGPDESAELAALREVNERLRAAATETLGCIMALTETSFPLGSLHENDFAVQGLRAALAPSQPDAKPRTPLSNENRESRRAVSIAMTDPPASGEGKVNS